MFTPSVVDPVSTISSALQFTTPATRERRSSAAPSMRPKKADPPRPSSI